MPLLLDIRGTLAPVTAGLDDLAKTQVPFASARALTSTAQILAAGERQNMQAKFKAPRAFTLNAVGVIAARKVNPVATVFVKNRQADYLAPSEFDTMQFLGAGKRIRTPVDIRTNGPGDIPAGRIAQLLAQPNVFIGRAGAGGVGGIWQRSAPNHPGAGRGGKGFPRIKGGNAAQKRKLQLLVAFTRPKKVKTTLGYESLASQLVNANLVTEFGKALKQAIATAR